MKFPGTGSSLQAYLTRITGKSVSLVVTDNSTSMLSVKKKGDAVFIRVHWMFLSAEDDVIEEIAEFIKNRKFSTPLIRSFIIENRYSLKKKPSRHIRIRTRGKFHDLREILDSLNKNYFKGRITSRITWGNKFISGKVKKRTLGSYCSTSNTIIITPFLDRKKVPRYFLEFVVYHEMLHSEMLCEETVINGRRSIHSSEFKKREQLFEQYDKALLWEKKH
jgi:predicted metal-dependent hydrolase